MKMRLLDVSADALHECTAVSAVVAEAMALGVVKKSGANLGVSITGVAGPEPDEDGNPVGLVYCGVARDDGSTQHVKLEVGKKQPEAVVEDACEASLALLRDFALS
jgi:nicotinamide-nucleotide amidase